MLAAQELARGKKIVEDGAMVVAVDDNMLLAMVEVLEADMAASKEKAEQEQEAKGVVEMSKENPKEAEVGSRIRRQKGQ